MHKYTLFLLALAALHCAGLRQPAPPSAAPPLETLLEWLSGDFDNFAQEAALPDSVSRQPAISGDWLNALCARQYLVETPQLNGRALYLQWHEASCAGTISRQRLWVFRADEQGRILMDFYAFREPEKYVDAQLQPQLLRDVDETQLVAYPEGCTLKWVYREGGYQGRLDPETCAIIARQSGREMRLEAVIEAGPGGFSYRESGRLPDGAFAFVAPGREAYRFVKK